MFHKTRVWAVFLESGNPLNVYSGRICCLSLPAIRYLSAKSNESEALAVTDGVS